MAAWLVRPAGAADAPQLAALAAQTFPLACPPGLDPSAVAVHIEQRLSASAFRANLADLGLEYSVAELPGGLLVGYLLLALDPPPVAVAQSLGANGSVGANGSLGADGSFEASRPHPIELRQIYLHPDLHGSGCADALIEVAARRSRELGAGLWLGTSKQNARAIAFYRRHGFEPRGERIFMVGGVPNEDWLLVRKA